MADQRGQAMVEFSLVVITLLVILFGLIDLMRVGQANSTVAEAARQGARQAVANAASADSPLAAPNGQSCSGTAYTSGATGTGCLTDAAILTTVKTVLAPVVGKVTLYANTTAWSCPAAPVGQASVCISPSETGAAGAYATCAAATVALGHDPKPGDLGSRSAEFTATTFKGCFLVQVTVSYSYAPVTPLIGQIIGHYDKIFASTSMLAEY